MDGRPWTSLVLLDPQQRIFLPYLVLASLVAAAFLRFHHLDHGYFFSRKIWLHKSARLDYLFFLISKLLQSFVLVPLIPSVSYLMEGQLSLLHGIGYMSPIQWSGGTVMVLYSVVLFLLNDFSRFLCHLMMHRSKILWNFHRVHHSAAVLTPFTFYRVHPVETLIYGVRYGLVTSIVTSGFVFLFGAQVQMLQVLGINAGIIVAQILLANLRHSHVPISFPKFVECLLISPRQHQMHHESRSCGTNYGSTLALWDLVFKTWHYSQGRGLQPFGIDSFTMKQHQSLIGLITEPFIRTFQQILRRRHS